MNMVKGYIRVFPKMTRSTVDNEVHKRWLPTTGVLYGRHQLANVTGERRTMTFFLVRIPDIETLLII